MYAMIPSKMAPVGDQNSNSGIVGHQPNPMQSSNWGSAGATINNVPVGPAPVPIHTDESWQFPDEDNVSVASTQQCISVLIPQRPLAPPPQPPPHSRAQHDEIFAGFGRYGLDPESACYIRDVESEMMNKHQIRRHMEKLFASADKPNWNRQVPRNCNIQIFSVSLQFKAQAETCGCYLHNHLKLLCSAARMVQAWHNNVRNVDRMDQGKCKLCCCGTF